MAELIVLVVAVYAGVAAPVYVMGKKCNVPHSWISFVPLGWLVVLAWVSDRSAMNAIWSLIPIPIVSTVCYYHLWKAALEYNEVRPLAALFGIIPFAAWLPALQVKPVARVAITGNPAFARVAVGDDRFVDRTEP
jgi:hypothetical protein